MPVTKRKQDTYPLVKESLSLAQISKAFGVPNSAFDPNSVEGKMLLALYAVFVNFWQKIRNMTSEYINQQTMLRQLVNQEKPAVVIRVLEADPQTLPGNKQEDLKELQQLLEELLELYAKISLFVKERSVRAQSFRQKQIQAFKQQADKIKQELIEDGYSEEDVNNDWQQIVDGMDDLLNSYMTHAPQNNPMLRPITTDDTSYDERDYFANDYQNDDYQNDDYQNDDYQNDDYQYSNDEIFGYHDSFVRDYIQNTLDPHNRLKTLQSDRTKNLIYLMCRRADVFFYSDATSYNKFMHDLESTTNKIQQIEHIKLDNGFAAVEKLRGDEYKSDHYRPFTNSNNKPKPDNYSNSDNKYNSPSDNYATSNIKPSSR